MKSSTAFLGCVGLVVAANWICPITTAYGADLAACGFAKEVTYYQFNDAGPFEFVGIYQGIAFAAGTSATALTGAVLKRPNGLPDQSLTHKQDGWFLPDEEFSTQTELDQAYPNGSYTMVIQGASDGQRQVPLTVSGNSYPPAPKVLNFTALQDIDPSAALTLSWNAFTGGTANDAIFVQIYDDSADEAVFQTSIPGLPGALSGTATSVVVPANTLEPDTAYTLDVSFFKITSRDTTSYPGAVGLAGYAKTTQTFIQTGEGGTVDTTPPALRQSDPLNLATQVPIDKVITFTFTEAMAASQSVAWSANLTPAKFTYSWSADGRTLSCVYSEPLPKNATITWKLNPTGSPALFRDLANNPLPAEVFSGSFTTSSTISGPCNPNDLPSGVGGFAWSKLLRYTQTSDAAPVPATQDHAQFYASVTSPATNAVTAATMTRPGGGIETLTNFFGGNFMLYQTFANETALDAATPAGTYTANLTRTDGSHPALPVSVAAGATPPTPQILNYSAAQAIDPAQAFELRWNGFTGAGEHDVLSLALVNAEFQFIAPDLCVPRPLPNTATSIVIPANTLPAGMTFEGTLSYMRVLGQNTNAIPDMIGYASAGKMLEFTVKTTGGPASGCRFTDWRMLANGHFWLELTGEAGKTYVIEASADLQSWTVLTAVMAPANGIMTAEDPRVGAPKNMGYRARAL